MLLPSSLDDPIRTILYALSRDNDDYLRCYLFVRRFCSFITRVELDT